MKETIRNLFGGKICPFEDLKASKEEKQILQKINRYKELLLESIDNNRLEILEKYDNSLSELSDLYYEEFFINGFCLGLKLAVEGLI